MASVQRRRREAPTPRPWPLLGSGPGRPAHHLRSPQGLLAVALACALGPTRITALASDDIMATKVWLDQHLFNKTLRTTRMEDGSRVFLMAEDKAFEQGLDWPPAQWPTLCFLGIGSSSIEYLTVLARLFPELQLVLMDVQESSWLTTLAETLGEGTSRVGLGRVEEFAEAQGAKRRRCDGISWSVDTPPFSFYRYRELFYSVPYVLSLFNMQGCTKDTRTTDVDKYYCEYLVSSFQSTLCGKVNEHKSAEYRGEELYFPMVDAGCAENVCMCHAHSDAFSDIHFDHLCRKNQPHRFEGQWGQDEFLLRNIFHTDKLEGKGVYVDVGASHPFHLSNTAYFDSCLGWSGFCLEPNPRMRPIISALRTCRVINACAWANVTQMRFSNGGELAAPTQDDSLAPSRPFEASPNGTTGTFFEATCAPLHDLLLVAEPALLKTMQAGRKPRIDLLSVDAEGAEIPIFKGFPFEAWDIRVIVVETSRRTSMAIDSLLLPRGFFKVAVLGKDAVYVSRETVDLLPRSGPQLPEWILWNEPGTDRDMIEYERFQRLFGVEGDLDVEVGDQRLLNETELERQHRRSDALQNASMKHLMQHAEKAVVGGKLSEKQRELMRQPWVQETLGDPQVKAALALLLGDDEDAFVREVASNARLKVKMGDLLRAGVVSHAKAAEVLGIQPSSETPLEASSDRT